MKPTPPDAYRPEFDPGKFRYAAALYARLLIRARWKCEPGFLGEADLAAWGLADIGTDRWPAWRLLGQAAEVLGVINTQSLERCGSGGVRPADESTPEGRLVFAVAFLTPTEGGGPEHNGALVEASRRLREVGAVDWSSLVAWETLPEIRADLDALPHPRKASTTPSDSPELGRIEEMVRSLLEREQVKDFYSVEEFANILSKAEFTCREWCRLGRIRATKKHSGRGKHQAWVISHDELLRYRREGLLSPPR